MSIYFFPGCKYSAHNPEGIQKLSSYLSQQFGVVSAGCCSVDHAKPEPEDLVLYQCPTCGLILSESGRCPSLQSIYEFLLTDSDFPWPDYQGRSMTIQDCWRVRENSGYLDAIRQVIWRMNICGVELERNRERANFCGVTLYQEPSERYERLAYQSLVVHGAFHPCSREEQLANMRAHGRQYTTDEVICVCTGCMEGVRLGGHRPVHLLDLVLDMD